MSYKSISAVFLLAVAAAGIAAAAEIYRWTDDDGNVHYTDKPLGDSPVRLAIESRPTDNARVQAQVQQRQERRAAAAEAAASADDGPTPEELRAQARERDERCNTYKARLTSFVQSRRLYREDENGERIYLSDDEIDAARAKVQRQVEENCDS